MAFSIITLLAVYLYGLCLTSSFLSLPLTKKWLAIAVIQTIFSVGVQLVLLRYFGSDAVQMAYPFVVHLPIFLSAVFIYKRSVSSSAVAILAAFLLSIPRNLCGELVALFWTFPYAKTLTNILVTVPLLLLFLKLLTPLMRKLLLRPAREKVLFLAPAGAYYVIIYATSVYTDIAYKGSSATVSVLITLLCFFTFVYVFMDYRHLAEISELKSNQGIMDLQAQETERLLEQIRYTQAKTKTMRHDLRHYLQIIYDDAAKGNTDAIKKYIRSIQDEIEDTVMLEFCKNESVNLILSSYSGKAKHLGAELVISAGIPEKLDNELDVCVLLANALENALHACAGMKNPVITAQCNLYANKTVIQIRNPYEGEIKFADGLPVSSREDHGLGAKSIVALAERHGGAADFSCRDGMFMLRAVL